MLATLIQKELRSILRSPKFAATFAVCSSLLLLSVYTGIREYQVSVKQWEIGSRLADQQVREASNWRDFEYKVLRKPDPMQIFVSGLTYDIGRWSTISTSSSVRLRHSAYSDDPIYAVFRFVDFTFIFQIVLSLLAIVFTYDAINGEREGGTLRLVFSNSVSRARYIIAKCTGSWLGLVVPICVPVLLSLLLVIIYGVPLTGVDWAKITALVGISLLFLTFFVILGVFFSTLTRWSSVSFLVSLVVWVAFVLVIPQAGVMAAGQLVSVPREAEIEGRRDGYAKGLWAEHYKEMEERFREQNAGCGGSSADDDKDDEELWAEMQREDSLRRIIEQRIEVFETKLFDDLRQQRTAQQQLAFSLARFSPVSAYRLAAMILAGTDIALKQRYRDALNNYRTQFASYVEEKRAESGDQGGFVSITISSEDGLSIGSGRDDISLDVTDMPRFGPPVVTFAQAFSPVLVDFGILAIGILLVFFGSFVAFLRYDVR